jgi:hypothetical protein
MHHEVAFGLIDGVKFEIGVRFDCMQSACIVHLPQCVDGGSRQIKRLAESIGSIK